MALKQARHDWVFFLDSDEEIDSSSWQEIDRLIKRKDIDGVFVKRKGYINRYVGSDNW